MNSTIIKTNHQGVCLDSQLVSTVLDDNEKFSNREDSGNFVNKFTLERRDVHNDLACLNMR